MSAQLRSAFDPIADEAPPPRKSPLAPGDMPWSIIAGNIARVISGQLRPMFENISQRIDEIAGTTTDISEIVKVIKTTNLPNNHAGYLVELIRRELDPKPGQPINAAEIGVWTADTSWKLLESFPPDEQGKGGLYLYMVDLWGKSPAPDDWKLTGDPLAFQTPKVWQGAKAFAEACVKAHPGRCSMHQQPSTEIPLMIANGMLDFAFIDADHSYAAVAADIAAWWPKIKPGGILSGHDYLTEEETVSLHCCFGVIEAVDEFVKREGLPLKTDKESSVWWVRKP